MITWKLLFDVISHQMLMEDVDLARRIFLVGKISKFLTAGLYSSLIFNFSHKDLGEEGAIHNCLERKSNNEAGETF